MVDTRNAIEEIRSRINILDLVSEYVALRRAGKSNKGLCPFHTEKTPSFNVSEEFQTWHCFGCGAHGDVFSFLMKAENLTFVEALERLAKRAGVELDRFQSRQTGRRELLGRINALAAAYYSALLKRTPLAIEYLRDRELADQTIEQFRIGYAAPAWDGLVRHLTKENIKLADAAQAGLVIRGQRGYYDRFRHRIVFPILDIQDRVIGFGGRALGEEQPKYLNSPETALFNKTRALYGLNLARKVISEEGYAIVVEGYTDVTAAHQAGFENCIATLGTALTGEHIKVLSRYSNKAVLAYDADSAGMTAALRGAGMFTETECDVRIARLPPGNDPDSLLRKGRGAEFAAAVSDALPIVDYRLTLLREAHDMSTPAGRADMLKEAVRILAEIPGSIERERYIMTLARYHPSFETGTTRAEEHIRKDVELVTRRGSVGPTRGGGAGMPKPARALEKAELSVLRVLIRADENTDMLAEALTPKDFSSEVRQNAAGALLDMLKKRHSVNLPELLEAVTPEAGTIISELAMRDEGPPLDERALRDCVALMRKSGRRKLRTSDVLGPYIKDGIIDMGENPREQTMEELTAFLKESGKLPNEDTLKGDE